MSSRTGFAVARFVVALGILVALVFQFQHSVDGAFEAVNFFSFFTVLSNIAAAAFLLWEVARPPETQTPKVAAFRGAVTLYMAITALVYAVLLAPASADVGLTLPWVDVVLHEVAPIALVLDWFVDKSRQLQGRRVILAWLVFPSLYLVYSLVRGNATNWYPYPFLDPDESGGYAGVAGYSAGVVATFVVVALLLHWWAVRSRS